MKESEWFRITFEISFSAYSGRHEDFGWRHENGTGTGPTSWQVYLAQIQRGQI